MKIPAGKLPIVAVLAVTGAFIGLALIPGNKKLQSARAELQAAQQTIWVEETRCANLTELALEVKKLRDATRNFLVRVPPKQDLGVFLEDVGQILNRNDIRNAILQPRPVVPIDVKTLPADSAEAAAGIQVSPVLVQFEGAFNPVFASLKEFEKLDRLARIETLTIKADPNRLGWLKVEMLVNIFFQPGEQR